MTFCIGISVADGLVALADTQIVKGEQISSKAKLSAIELGADTAFVMTSGLRSIRDKAMARLDDDLSDGTLAPVRAHELATAFGDRLKEIRAEDEEGLSAGGLRFDLNGIVGGRFRDDDAPQLFHVFPEGNWVHTTVDAPYVMIGRTYYGKPILDRLLRYDTPLDQALALAYLAFDATRASVNDVDFPIDVVTFASDAERPTQVRRDAADLGEARAWWQDRLAAALVEFPLDWADPLLGDPGSPADETSEVEA